MKNGRRTSRQPTSAVFFTDFVALDQDGSEKLTEKECPLLVEKGLGLGITAFVAASAASDEAATLQVSATGQIDAGAPEDFAGKKTEQASLLEVVSGHKEWAKRGRFHSACHAPATMERVHSELHDVLTKSREVLFDVKKKYWKTDEGKVATPHDALRFKAALSSIKRGLHQLERLAEHEEAESILSVAKSMIPSKISNMVTGGPTNHEKSLDFLKKLLDEVEAAEENFFPKFERVQHDYFNLWKTGNAKVGDGQVYGRTVEELVNQFHKEVGLIHYGR
ncbi:unnamed protein product [Amoebophrya sp. A120]|nr:unnamed protein product [Amoebophrya sp. A120]|eukprot:GSA120T00018335001.1